MGELPLVNMLEHIPDELLKLLVLIVFSIAISLFIIVPIILWRLIRKKPVFPRGEKLRSPKILYAGIGLFGSFGAISFITGTPYFGAAFLIIMCAYVIGLIAYRKGWRG